MNKITITIESNDDQPRRINPKPADAVELMKAAEQWKSKTGRRYPSWSEMLEIMDRLGYARRTRKAL
jgi:transposase